MITFKKFVCLFICFYIQVLFQTYSGQQLLIDEFLMNFCYFSFSDNCPKTIRWDFLTTSFWQMYIHRDFLLFHHLFGWTKRIFDECSGSDTKSCQYHKSIQFFFSRKNYCWNVRTELDNNLKKQKTALMNTLMKSKSEFVHYKHIFLSLMSLFLSSLKKKIEWPIWLFILYFNLLLFLFLEKGARKWTRR